jgi:tRNA A-37 threonylcarbamoyl transferase component Bud32
MSQPAVAPRLGNFETILELGRGGMGTALLARAMGAGGFERLVVIKRLNPEMLNQPEAIKRFLTEARVSASIHHAHVVGTHDVGQDDWGPFLVLDYVEGASLEELVDRAALRRETLPAPVVLRIALDALAGLSAVHEASDAQGRPLRILHRDISLQNVLVGRDGLARVADFGIAKSQLSNFSTDQSYLVGKLLYLPREYLRREPVGPTLDIYSLGITLWLTLTGVELWAGASEAQLVRHILDHEVPPPSTHVHVAPQIEGLLLKACAPEPGQRFQSAREMADAIEQVGRVTGWLANHAEVSATIERLAGADLARRRDHIAAVSWRTDPSDLVMRAQSDARPAEPVPEAEPLALRVVRRRRRWPWLAVALVLAASLLAAAALTLPSTRRLDEPLSPPYAAGLAEVPRAMPTPLATPAEESTKPVEDTGTSPSPAAASQPRPQVRVSGKQRVSAPAPPAPTPQTPPPPRLPAPKPDPTPQPSPRSTGGVQAPESITKTNPYR